MKLILSQSGVDVTVDAFIEVTDAVENPPVEEWQQIMLRSAQLNFVAQGRPEPWLPLSEATLKGRRNNDKSSILILRDTGLLMQSLQPGEMNEYSIRSTSKTEARIGTTRPGAANHNEGISVPQRRFLMHQEQDIDDFKIVWEDHIAQSLEVK